MSHAPTGAPESAAVPRITCLSTDADAADVLRASVQALLPVALVESVDLGLLRDPPRSEVVIVAVGALAAASESIVRDLRARGYRHAILVIADTPEMLPTAGLATLGVQRTIATAAFGVSLPTELNALLQWQEHTLATEGGRRLLESVRRLQMLLAAGQLATRLQHRLNNPLAALLAEAQLLELESMAPDHAVSVHRIIELCRRVIEETKSIEGLANADGVPGR
ncbi:MAG: hypothetical protein IT361_02235 [Gemmatimonadaceae bacterium]|nr:hypothetical protein [Gemmatimonadaceae bacterium]